MTHHSVETLALPPRPSWLVRFWPPLPVWRRLDLAVLVVVLYTAADVAINRAIDLKSPTWMGELAVVNGILLGVLLAFRNREAYERWWEARRQWGQLINDSRNLCLKARSAADAAGRAELHRLVPGFALALKAHLRGGGTLQQVPGFETDPATPAHVPLHLAGRVVDLLDGWRAAGRLTDTDLFRLDVHVRALMEVTGACERIRSTPVPPSYRALLRHGTILYLATAPWFLGSDFGYWSIAVTGLMAYFLLGIELTAEDVEEPFGSDGDDLDLSRFCRTIQASADVILNPKSIP
jgi:putative membrane protein